MDRMNVVEYRMNVVGQNECYREQSKNNCRGLNKSSGDRMNVLEDRMNVMGME